MVAELSHYLSKYVPVVGLTHSLCGGSKLMKIVVFSVLNVTNVRSTWRNGGSQLTFHSVSHNQNIVEDILGSKMAVPTSSSPTNQPSSIS